MKSTNEITLVIYSRLQDINYNSVIENKSSINRRNNWYWLVHGQDIQPWSKRASFPGYPLHPKESLGMKLINSHQEVYVAVLCHFQDEFWKCNISTSITSQQCQQHLNNTSTNMSTNISATCQQCQQHLNNMSTNMSTNTSTACQQHVNEHMVVTMSVVWWGSLLIQVR